MSIEEIISNQLGKQVLSVEYTAEQLKGGTVGDVKLITGEAKTTDGANTPFKLVWKSQKKWVRPGDPDSWLREYYIYTTDIKNMFTDSLNIPKCYHAELSDELLQLWIEYAEGNSGLDLTMSMLTETAEAFGRFQGKLYKHPEILSGIHNLSDNEFVRLENGQWYDQEYTYDFLSSDGCRIPSHVKKWVRENPWNDSASLENHYLHSESCMLPKHLQQMLITEDDNRENLFSEMKKQTVVLCHRDFWNENIIYKDGRVILLDWDCMGPGYVGEDIASLIADDIDISMLKEYFDKLIPAYYAGLSENIDGLKIDRLYIWRLIILKFGYRKLQTFIFSDAPEDRDEAVEWLRVMYEIKQSI